MSYLSRYIVPAILLLIGAAQAHASSVFNFIFSSTDGNGYINVSATSNGDGSYTATSGTLTLAITSGVDAGMSGTYSLYPHPNPNADPTDPNAPGPDTSNSGWFPYDNLLFPSTSTLDLTVKGLLFTGPPCTPGDCFEVNIWGLYDSSTGNDYGFSVYDSLKGDIVINPPQPPNFDFAHSNISSFVIPEPATLALFGVGLAAMRLTKRGKIA